MHIFPCKVANVVFSVCLLAWSSLTSTIVVTLLEFCHLMISKKDLCDLDKIISRLLSSDIFCYSLRCWLVLSKVAMKSQDRQLETSSESQWGLPYTLLNASFVLLQSWWDIKFVVAENLLRIWRSLQKIVLCLIQVILILLLIWSHGSSAKGVVKQWMPPWPNFHMISMLLAHRFVIHEYYFYRFYYFALHIKPGGDSICKGRGCLSENLN